jgi:hypothetical protein
MRVKRSTCSMTDSFQVTSTAFSEAGDQVYSAGLDNAIKVWDLRKAGQASLVLQGHSDTVTGIKASPDGTHLLSNSMDNTVGGWASAALWPATAAAAGAAKQEETGGGDGEPSRATPLCCDGCQAPRAVQRVKHATIGLAALPAGSTRAASTTARHMPGTCSSFHHKVATHTTGPS